MDNKYSVSKKTILVLTYFGGWIGALIVFLIDKELDKEIKFHMIQCLLITLLGVVTCGLGAIINLILGIMAACGKEIPRIPLISDFADNLNK